MPSLEIRTGRHAGKTYELTKNVILGRGDTADIQLPDGKASREHARVFKQAGKWAVADLNSRNGIKINGLKATRKDLFDGDQFEVGETLVAFVGEAGAALAAAAHDEVEELDIGLGDDDEPAAAASSRQEIPVQSSAPPSTAKRASDAKASKKEAAFAAARAKAAGKPSGGRASSDPPKTGIDVSGKVLQFNKVDSNKSSLMSIELSQYSTFTQFLIWCGVVGVLGVLVWFLFKTMADAAL